MDLSLPTAEQTALRINHQIASEMNVRPVTGGLDDTQLRTIEERLIYLRELEERRAAILKSIHEQGK